VDFDDGFVAYINGVEVARANIGTVGIPPAYNESATTFVEPLIVYGGKPNAYIIKTSNLFCRKEKMYLRFRFITMVLVHPILL